MAKRKNPFFDEFPSQIKFHISPKEINLGVNMSTHMPGVYERTWQLLRDGARKQFAESTFDPLNCVVLSPPATPPGDNKQIQNIDESVVNQNDQLVPSKYRQEKFHEKSLHQRNIHFQSCGYCQKPSDLTGGFNCSFCHRSICSGCRRVCRACEGDFCPLCSTLRYDEYEEHAICLTCLS
ncbi:apoptosis regulatory protein Siva-like isoform X2 [Tachypleus tridentatus]|uniref:apoptosis regulatory protein Siva-like isoform X2 n=1 Tax=Tachypleus tridentatus TaxID=6853 RepID=UPI003FD37018